MAIKNKYLKHILGALGGPIAGFLAMDKGERRKAAQFGVGALGGAAFGPKASAAIGYGQEAKRLGETTTEEWKEKTGFEEYQTPESYEQYKDLMGTMARQEMPGYTQMKKDIEATFGTTVGAGRNLGSAAQAAVLLGAGQDRLKALRQLGIAASQYQTGMQQQYAQAVGQGAQYEDMGYQYNQWLPWQMRMNEQTAARNASMQMGLDIADQAAAFGMQGANLFSQNQWMNRMIPQNVQHGMNPNFNFGGYPQQPAWNTGWIYNPESGKYEMKTW